MNDIAEKPLSIRTSTACRSHELPTLREFAHEYLHHYVAADGKLYPTMKLLLFKLQKLTPGAFAA